MTDYADYLDAVTDAIHRPPEQWAFKRDPRYTAVLEHVTPEQGWQFREEAQHRSHGFWKRLEQEFWPVAAKNDSLGKPTLAQYGEDCWCSPSNWRYLLHAILLDEVIDSCTNLPAHVIEIGGGYGGLALFTTLLAGIGKGRRIASYTIVDLPEACILQRLYARQLGVPLRTAGPAPGGLFEQPSEYVCVSNYAYSELDDETRAWLGERVVQRCQHGLMVWNGEAHPMFAGPPAALQPYVATPLDIEPERPLTGSGNVVVRW